VHVGHTSVCMQSAALSWCHHACHRSVIYILSCIRWIVMPTSAYH
jgi:hypothetical protein